MLNAVGDYLARITPEHADKPNYMAVVAMVVQPFADAQAFLASIPTAFDLDTAIGVQLDAVGIRIGLSRRVPVPLGNIYFSIDDPKRGLDQGVLYDPNYGDEYGIALLDDTTYRRCLYAKRLANDWDGTLPTAKTIVETLLGVLKTVSDFDSEFLASEFVTQTLTQSLTKVIVQDDSTPAYLNVFFAVDDETAGLDQGVIYNPGETVASVPAAEVGMTIGVAGVLPPLYLLFLLEQQLLVKPMGVPIDYEFTTVAGAPLFGIDVDNEFIGGLDRGAIGNTAEYILNAPNNLAYA